MSVLVVQLAFVLYYLSKSVVLGQSQGPTSAGDTFVLSDGLLGLLGFSAFVLILLVINWVCFILCTRKSVLLQRKADKARMKRQIEERQFSDQLRVLVNREVNRKIQKRQEESNNRNRQDTRQGSQTQIPLSNPSRQGTETSNGTSPGQSDHMQDFSVEMQRPYKILEDWPEDIALQRLPRASASPARHEQITNQSDPPPPQYADVMQNPWSFSGRPTRDTSSVAALEQLRSWPQFV